jgi:hypothetical protein
MSKTQKKRFFGMTFAQLGILGFLVLVAIGIIFGGLILISSPSVPGNPAVASMPAPTFPSQPTIASDQAEETGVPPTVPLIQADGQIPPNWKQYKASTIEILLPPQFISSINIPATRQEHIDSYRGQGLEVLAQNLENDSFDYRFWFDYPQPDTVVYGTHIIVKADVLPTETLDEYIDEAYGTGLQSFQVTDRQGFAAEDLEAQRILLDASFNDLSISVAEYVITDGVNLWIISCSSTFEEFSTWLPVFDQVAGSFRLLY